MSGILASSLVALALVSQPPVWSGAHQARDDNPYLPKQSQYWDVTNSRLVIVEETWDGRRVRWLDSKGKSGFEYRDIGVEEEGKD